MYQVRRRPQRMQRKLVRGSAAAMASCCASGSAPLHSAGCARLSSLLAVCSTSSGPHSFALRPSCVGTYRLRSMVEDACGKHRRRWQRRIRARLASFAAARGGGRRRCLGGCSAVRGELTSARHIRVGHACVLHVPRIDRAPLSRTMQRCGQRQVRRWGHRASPAGTAPPRSTRERGSTSLSETPRWHLSIRLATVTDWSAMLEDVRAYVVAVEASPSGRAAPDCGFGVRSLYNQVHIDWSLQDLPHAGFRPPPGTWNLEPRRNLYAS